jgi:hypothetical protein
MTNINKNLIRTHFSVLGFVILNFIIKLITNYGVNSELIFILKIVIYVSGIVLFFMNRKQLKKISIYFFYYLISVIIICFFWLFGGIFLAILSSIVLKPIFHKEIKYQKENLKIYSNFSGFFASCCEYEVVENKLLIFEKSYGILRIEGQLETENNEIEIKNNQVVYKNKVVNFNSEK